MVSEYVQRVRQQQATGPYRLLGWSLGGGLAQAMAVQLQAAGEQVELLALMDSYPVAAWQQRPLPTMHDALVTVLSVNGEVDADSQGLSLSQEAIYQRLLRPGSPLATLGRSALERLAESALHGMQLFRRSQTSSYHGDLLLFHAGQNPDDAPQPASWHPYVQGQFDCVDIDCNHFGMSDPAPMAVIGRELAKRLQSSISNKE
jgi:thioesterase domain-containing protein